MVSIYIFHALLCLIQYIHFIGVEIGGFCFFVVIFVCRIFEHLNMIWSLETEKDDSPLITDNKKKKDKIRCHTGGSADNGSSKTCEPIGGHI